MASEPKVTYEVWSRDVSTGDAHPGDRSDAGFIGKTVPTCLATEYNFTEETNARNEGRPLHRKFIVVKATTTYEEVL